jgi:hypothetical protein
MGRLFTCGFEEGSNGTSTMWTTRSTGSTLTTTGTPHSGLYHCEVQTNNLGVTKNLGSDHTGGTFYTRFYWKPATLPTSGTNTPICQITSGGGAAAVIVYHVRADNTLLLYQGVAPNNSIATTATVTAGTYYRIELELVMSNTTGTLTLRLYQGDSTTVMTGGDKSITGIDTIPSNIRIWGFPNLAVDNGQLWYYDDIAINKVDASGVQDSWAGPGKIALQIGNADVTTGWTPGTGTTHFTLLDDVPGTPTDDTASDYIFSATATSIDWLGLPGLPAEVPTGAALVLAAVNARHRGVAVTPTIRLKFYDGATIFNGTYITTATTYASSAAQLTTVTMQLTVNLAGKTKADATTFRHGVELGDSLEARVSCMWTDVEWLPAAAGTIIEVPTTVYTGP